MYRSGECRSGNITISNALRNNRTTPFTISLAVVGGGRPSIIRSVLCTMTQWQQWSVRYDAPRQSSIAMGEWNGVGAVSMSEFVASLRREAYSPGVRWGRIPI